jgi:putative colanic acid biosynthesis acetyltransferase WcaF
MSAPVPADRLTRLTQADPYSSPWTVSHRIRVLVWTVVWAVLFRPTPKPLSPWRVLLLRLFGCKVAGRPFVAASAVIRQPWNLTLEHRACLGPGSEVYNLGPVAIREGATVAQHAYLCAGTHDFADPALPLVVGPIEVGARAFIGARAFVLPGVVVGARAVVGACAVVTRDVPADAVVAGNPARVVGERPLPDGERGTE